MAVGLKVLNSRLCFTAVFFFNTCIEHGDLSDKILFIYCLNTSNNSKQSRIDDAPCPPSGGAQRV